tara:strand:+ start:62 stop:1123 length:1062 start_codon:yes stop_codon:yes gene_type:complete
MINLIKSYYKSTRYILNLVQFNEDKIDSIDYKDEHYLGLNSEKTPVRIFYSKNKKAQSVIIFPGASPYAENHPGMIMLANALRNVGYNVFLPRIPNLKNLLIVKENVEWFSHCYKELLKHPQTSNKIMVVGMSYGGANLLKASFKKRFTDNPPKSILSYGTYYSIETALNFFLTGEISYQNKLHKITPHEWGTIVIFYNFFKTIETNFDKEKITLLLKCRIEDKDDEVEKIKKELNSDERDLVDKILNGNIDQKIKNMILQMIDNNKDLLNYLSPKNWAENIDIKTFIMHGANDSMVPFTESTMLASKIKNSQILISFLYEHREMSNDRGVFFKIKEILKMINFFALYFRFNK